MNSEKNMALNTFQYNQVINIVNQYVSKINRNI